MSLSRRSFLANALRAIFNRVCPVNEPEWTVVPQRRPYLPDELGKVLADIDCRLPATGLVSSATYRSSDYGNWAHEATHGVNSMVRNWKGAGWNAMYCLYGRAFDLREPNLTLAQCARYVPVALRSNMYRDHLIKQQASWGNCPLYALDEWSAYINGTLCGIEQLEMGRGIGGGGASLRQMIETGVNSLAVAIGASGLLNYPHRDRLYRFFKWNWERMLQTMAAAEKYPQMHLREPYEYYQALSTSTDYHVAVVREWCRGTFGQEWVTEVMFC